jgi:hypothetical protein
MRKIALLITIVILCLLASQGFSQKKDSVPSYDTVYVFATKDIAALRSIIMNSRITGDEGQPFTGNQLLQLLNWMDGRRTLIPKQQPKK